MTYASELSGKDNIGYYIAFDGIATRIATHDMTAYGLSGTFLNVIVRETMEGRAWKLNRQKGFVEPGGFGCTVMANASVLSLFRRKGGTRTDLTQSVSATATTIPANVTGLGSTTAYVGMETVTLGTYTGSGYSGCTRGVNNSVATSHSGGTTLSTVPTGWQHRRCTLNAVNLSTGSEQELGAFLMTSAPRFSNGTFQLDFAGVGILLKRPCMTGWQEQTAKQVEEAGAITGAPAWANETVRFYVDDATHFAYEGSEAAAVKIDVGDKWGIFPLVGTSPITINAPSSPDTIVIAMSIRLPGGTLGYDDVLSADAGSVTLRQVAILRGRPGLVAARLLVSDLGDGTNGSLDDYVGQPANATSGSFLQPRKRTGAAIPAAWVDTDSFLQAPETREMFLVLDEQRPALDILTEEILWRMGGYVYDSPDGLITFKQYAPETIRNAATAVGNSVYGRAAVAAIDDEDTILSRASVKCNYHPKDGFQKTIEVVFSTEENLMGEAQQELELESRSLTVAGNHGGLLTEGNTAFETVVAMLERLHARYKLGGRRVAMLMPWHWSERIRIGQRISLTDERMPDLAGSLGVSGLVMEVVEYDPDYTLGNVVVTVEEVLTGVRHGPSAIVASHASNVITLKDTGPHGDGKLFEDNPGLLFLTDSIVRWRFAATDYNTYEDGEVSARTANTVTLKNTPTIAPSADDLLVMLDGDDTGNANSSGADVQDYAAGADASYVVGAGETWEREGPVWG